MQQTRHFLHGDAQPINGVQPLNAQTTKAAEELAAEIRNVVKEAVEKAICCRVQFKPS